MDHQIRSTGHRGGADDLGQRGLGAWQTTQRDALSIVLTIDMNKEVPSVYIAGAQEGCVLVTEPENYDRIETAIREQALSIPVGFAHFVEFTYGAKSNGTFAIAEVPARAAELADRLVALNAEMHMIEESIKLVAVQRL